MAVNRTRLMRIVLVVSLALNLFVVSAVAVDAVTDGGWTRSFLGMHGGRGPGLLGLPNPRELRAILPEQDRAVLDSTMEAHRTQFHERFEAIGAARDAVTAAIKTEPFDPAKLEAAFADLSARWRAVSAEAQAMLTDLVTHLSPEGRAKLAQMMAERRKPRD
jgi:Spy/CpxP family protein refolding chaperone